MVDVGFEYDSLSNLPHDMAQPDSKGANERNSQNNSCQAEESQKADDCDSHIQPANYDPFELYEPSEDKDMAKKTSNKSEKPFKHCYYL